MLDFGWIFLILAGFVALFVAWIWPLVKISWLQKITFTLVLSLPFERVPSIEFSGVNVRISQILVLLGFSCLGILLAKQDPEILKTKVNSFIYWVLAFWVALLPSLFWVVNGQRQLQVLIATALVFGATFLISNFLKDVLHTVKWLMVVMAGVGMFGLFQFVADFVGVPYTITLLREHYTKRVFGFARVHATALEPLYWGGMLLLPCVFLLVYFIFKEQSHKHSNDESESSTFLNYFYNSKWLQLGVISLLYLNLVLTLSRGAYLAFGFSLILALLLCFRFISWKTVRIWFLPYIIIFVAATGIFVFSTNSDKLISTAVDHVLNVFTEKQTSTVERLGFLNDAFNLLYKNILLGIGSGNYGPRVQNNIPENDGGWLIVNNVYVEIWLEQGILAILAFISMLTFYLKNSFQKVFRSINKYKTEPQNPENLILQISIVAAVCGYLLQWMTFSPIFIMPFFILFGIMIKSLEL
jgi:hypothetical protein